MLPDTRRALLRTPGANMSMWAVAPKRFRQIYAHSGNPCWSFGLAGKRFFIVESVSPLTDSVTVESRTERITEGAHCTSPTGSFSGRFVSGPSERMAFRAKIARSHHA